LWAIGSVFRTVLVNHGVHEVKPPLGDKLVKGEDAKVLKEIFSMTEAYVFEMK
jgi:hypothetical protein